MSHVFKSFSKVAGHYQANALVQEEVAELLVQQIGKLGEQVLEIGPGTGLLTNKIMNSFSPDRYLGVEPSEKMSDYLSSLGYDIVCNDFLSFESAECFDNIISSSALHWIKPFERTAEKVLSLLKPDGSCYFSVMLDGTLEEVHRARSAVTGQHNNPWELPDSGFVSSCFRRAGADIEVLEERSFKLRYSDSMSMLKSLSNTGVTARCSGAYHLKRSEVNRLVAILEPVVNYKVGFYRVTC